MTALKEEVMKQIICLIAVAAFCSGSPVLAATKCDKEACSKVKADIREVEAKMRSGYTVAQGNRYESRLRKLRDKRRRICR